MAKIEEHQLDIINGYLKKRGITYSDIRYEIADHILCHIEEESTLTPGNFDERLNAYMHSHHMVKLVTLAKEQERLREKAYRGEVASVLFSAKGIAVFLVAFGLVYLGFQYTISNYITKGMLAGLLFFSIWATAFRSGGDAFPYYKRIFEQSGFYVVLPGFFMWLSRRLFERQSVMVQLTDAAGMVFIALVLLLMWQVNEKHNRNYYA